MAKLVHGGNDPILRALLALCGCPKYVRSFECRAAVGAATRVTIEYLPDVDGLDPSLKPIVAQFKLVPMENTPWPFPPPAEHPIMDRAELQRRQDALVAEGREIK